MSMLSGAEEDAVEQLVGGRRPRELDPTQTVIAAVTDGLAGLTGGGAPIAAKALLSDDRVGQHGIAEPADCYPSFIFLPHSLLLVMPARVQVRANRPSMP